MDLDRRIRLELTPDKSMVAEKNGYVKIKYISKVGEVKRRKQCKSRWIAYLNILMRA